MQTSNALPSRPATPSRLAPGAPSGDPGPAWHPTNRPANLGADWGLAVAWVRQQAGLSQHELAARAGIDQAHVSKIEGGRIDPTLRVARAIAHALRVSLDYLDGLHPREEQIDHNGRAHLPYGVRYQARSARVQPGA